MFIHMVLFKIKKKNIPIYLKDCRLWANAAKKHAGFIGYQTLFRTNEKDQYASLYTWKDETHHSRFMKKNHDHLVLLSHCPVQVMGYYNFASHS